MARSNSPTESAVSGFTGTSDQSSGAARHDAGNSRQVPDRLDLREAGAFEERLDRARLPLAHLDPEPATAHEHVGGGRNQVTDHVESVGAREQSVARLVQVDLRLK